MTIEADEPGGTLPALRLTLALLLAGGVAAASVASVGAYYDDHHGAAEQAHRAWYEVTLAPTQPGPYTVEVPVPSAEGLEGVPGIAVRVLAGAPRFGLVESGHGTVLRVQASGPVTLRADAPFPVRLSTDDFATGLVQFKFWSYLGDDAPAPVLLKLEVRQVNHTEDWDQHVDVSQALVLQTALEPSGWQPVHATLYGDVQMGSGFGAAFPHLQLGAAAAGLAGLYAPAGALLLGVVRRGPRC